MNGKYAAYMIYSIAWGRRETEDAIENRHLAIGNFFQCFHPETGFPKKQQ
jgi:hypothetical protein